MRSVSVVMAYYNNPQMLQMHYKWMANFAPDIRDHLEYVVVDDGSRQVPAVGPGENWPVDFQLYKITVDVRWNQDAARNIGVFHAENEWVLLTDQDHLVPEPTLRRLMTVHKLDPQAVYRFSRLDYPTMQPYKLHPNSWFMTKKLFLDMRGYDERFAGWYGSDSDFRERVKVHASRMVQLDDPLFRVPREVMPDASTPKEYGRKSPMDGQAIQRIKGERKQDKDPRPLFMTFPYERVV